jgi:hypothetical protein
LTGAERGETKIQITKVFVRNRTITDGPSQSRGARHSSARRRQVCFLIAREEAIYMGVAVRIEVARLTKKLRGVCVRYVDDVGVPKDDGRFVTLALECEGHVSEVIVLTTENFYAALGKVMEKALPAFNGDKLS